MKNSTKSIPTINPAITENIRNVRLLKCAPHLSILKWACRLVIGFVSLLVVRTCRTAFQAKNNVWSTPADSALTLVSHQSHNARTANRHLRAKGERNGIQRRPIIFGKSMMRALELLRLAKRHILGRSDIEQWRNQGCSYSHYRVTLVWRHYSVSQ